MRLLTFALAGVIGTASVCLGQQGRPPDAARMEQVVQSYVTAGSFSGSVLVARAGEFNP